MVWWDDSQKQLWLAELSALRHRLRRQERARKEAKYTELVAAIEQVGYNTALITLEVGSQGALIPHLPGFTTLAHELAISQRDLSSLLHQCCQACSHHRLIQNLVYKDHIELKNYLAMYRLVPIMLKFLPIILFYYSQDTAYQHSYRLATASNAEIQNVFEMEAQSLGGDIGPECLQSDDSHSLNAFGDIDALIADLLEFATTPPTTTEC